MVQIFKTTKKVPDDLSHVCQSIHQVRSKELKKAQKQRDDI